MSFLLICGFRYTKHNMYMNSNYLTHCIYTVLIIVSMTQSRFALGRQNNFSYINMNFVSLFPSLSKVVNQKMYLKCLKTVNNRQQKTNVNNIYMTTN